MERVLLLMRHGKSKWDDDQLRDHDRPLAKRGKRDSERIGQALESKDWTPDVILASTAKRAAKTAKRVAKSCEYDKDILYQPSLYWGDLRSYVQALSTLDDDDQIALLIAHNPTLEDLAHWLTQQHIAMPTCTVVAIRLEINRWGDIADRPSVQLAAVLRPKEID